MSGRSRPARPGQQSELLQVSTLGRGQGTGLLGCSQGRGLLGVVREGVTTEDVPGVYVVPS